MCAAVWNVHQIPLSVWRLSIELNIYKEMKFDSLISLLKHRYTNTEYRVSQLNMEPTYRIYINNLCYII